MGSEFQLIINNDTKDFLIILQKRLGGWKENKINKDFLCQSEWQSVIFIVEKSLEK